MLIREVKLPPMMSFIDSIWRFAASFFGGATWPAKMIDCAESGRSIM